MKKARAETKPQVSSWKYERAGASLASHFQLPTLDFLPRRDALHTVLRVLGLAWADCAARTRTSIFFDRLFRVRPGFYLNRLGGVG
jgi:hypothetical protein